MSEQAALLCLQSWAGFTKHAVTIVGETPKRFRVRIDEDMVRLPSKRTGRRGDVFFVPKHAVKLVKDKA